MARRGVRVKDYERLDDLTLGRVVSLLEQDTPITKKAACEILNINYSTTRLAKILEEYKDKIIFAERRRKQNKGTPISTLETKDIVISYLSGEGITSISRRLFRSVHVLKAYINSLHLPERDKTTDYLHPKLMPEEMVTSSFDVGEYAWSARYNCVVEIRDYIGDLYRIYIFGKFMQFGYQPVEELGRLDILKQLKLDGTEFQTSQDFNMRVA